MTTPVKKRMLLLAPLVVLPFLCCIFVSLGGGRGKASGRKALPAGLNLQLPGAFPAVRKSLLDKLDAYQRADQDSMRKKEFAREDPYRPFFASPSTRDSGKRPAFGLLPAIRPPVSGDGKAEELLARLNRLRASLDQPDMQTTAVTTPREPNRMTAPSATPAAPAAGRTVARPHWIDTPAEDPQLDRLNRMLDKVIRIQHPSEDKPANGPGAAQLAEQLVPADSTANAIPAVVPENETLINGASLPLRLDDSVRLHGVVIAAGTWVYGTVSFRNDRMTVDIRSLRLGNNLYPADLQVYDLDGMPGIHIPMRLSQQVVKESASESVSGVDVLSADASWQAQAANAGVQAGKSLFGRRVRQVRVTVRAGYAVLLRNVNSGAAAPPARRRQGKDDLSPGHPVPEPPADLPHGHLIDRARTDGLELGLSGVYLQDSLLWLALEWRNRSSISYSPNYYRWIISDRHHFRRMAQQDLPLEPLTAGVLQPVPGDSTLGQWVAFRAFALAKDKELVLQAGEKDGGRTIELVIPSQLIFHAKIRDHGKDH